MFRILQKKSVRLKLTATIVVVFLLASLTWAVSTHRLKIWASGNYSWSVTGHVFDRNGNPLSGAKITNQKTGEFVLSGSDGLYTLSIPEGSSNVTYEKDGTIENPNFSDVLFDQNNLNDPTKTFWAAKYISALKKAGIVSGYKDGTYHPEWQVTRAQMSVFLTKILVGSEANVPAATGQTFTDVKPDYWAYNHIEYLVKNTAVSGYADRTFNPEGKVTRAQMAVFICKVLGLDGYNKINPSFTDVATDYWAYQQIERLVYLGIASGYSDGSYKPEEIVNRGQMSKFLALSFPSIKLTTGGYIPQLKTVVINPNSTTPNATLDVSLAPCGETNTITGQATKTDGTAIPGAKVVLTRKPFIEETYTTTTGTDGKFKFVNIPNGAFSYSVINPDVRLRYYSTSQPENSVELEGGAQTINLSGLTEAPM